MNIVLYLYRFWKSQTGGGLVLRRAFNRTHKDSISKYPFMKKLEMDLIENNKRGLIEGEEDKFSLKGHEFTMRAIKEYEREESINEILEDGK